MYPVYWQVSSCLCPKFHSCQKYSPFHGRLAQSVSITFFVDNQPINFISGVTTFPKQLSYNLGAGSTRTIEPNVSNSTTTFSPVSIVGMAITQMPNVMVCLLLILQLWCKNENVNILNLTFCDKLLSISKRVLLSFASISMIFIPSSFLSIFDALFSLCNLSIKGRLAEWAIEKLLQKSYGKLYQKFTPIKDDYLIELIFDLINVIFNAAPTIVLQTFILLGYDRDLPRVSQWLSILSSLYSILQVATICYIYPALHDPIADDISILQKIKECIKQFFKKVKMTIHPKHLILIFPNIVYNLGTHSLFLIVLWSMPTYWTIFNTALRYILILFLLLLSFVSLIIYNFYTLNQSSFMSFLVSKVFEFISAYEQKFNDPTIESNTNDPNIAGASSNKSKIIVSSVITPLFLFNLILRDDDKKPMNTIILNLLPFISNFLSLSITIIYVPLTILFYSEPLPQYLVGVAVALMICGFWYFGMLISSVKNSIVAENTNM